MQWLIDIIAEKVIAEIGIPPTFIDRGDPAAYDFITGFFTTDGAWHDLDLSGIVPEGTQAVVMKFAVRHVLVGKYFNLRELGNVNGFNSVTTQTKISQIYQRGDCVCPINVDRKLEYQISAPAWLGIFLVVKGWWL